MLISFAIPLLLLLIFKPLLAAYKQFRILQSQLDKVKANRNIFYSLLADNSLEFMPEHAKPLVFGPIDAKNTITVVTNPGCTHCAELHKEIERLQALNENIKINVIFAIDENKDVENFQVANALVTIYRKKGAQQTWQALQKWYNNTEKSFDKWLAALEISDEMLHNATRLNLHKDWCIGNKITYTPVVLLNGHKLPEMYELSEIPAFLN